MNKVKNKIFLDFETNGTDPLKCKIVSIGLFETDDQFQPTGKELEIFINPEEPVGDSFFIHKISDDFLIDKPKIQEVEKSVLDFLQDSDIIAHNGNNFDFILLKKYFSISDNKLIDSLDIARKKLKKRSYKLNDLIKHFDIYNDRFSEDGEIHSSLLDARLLSKVFYYLIYEDTSLLKEETFFKEENKKELFFENRNFLIPEEELLLHMEMVKKLKLDFF